MKTAPLKQYRFKIELAQYIGSGVSHVFFIETTARSKKAAERRIQELVKGDFGVTLADSCELIWRKSCPQK